MSHKNNGAPIFVGICFEGEEILIDGINIWQRKWKDMGSVAKVLDPKYKEEKYVRLYLIEAGGRGIYFYAGEFSNGVWGVYKPVADSHVG